MPNLSGGLSGAAGGALTGLSAGGPLGAVIGGGLGLIGGLFGGGGKSKLQKQLESKVDPVMNNLIHWSGQANDARKLLQPMGIKSLEKSSNFYNSLLSDDSVEALNGLLGPQRTGINEAYQNAIETNARTGPRGGGRASANANYQFQKNRDLMELVPKARMQAAQGALSAGQATTNAAQGFGSLALQNSQAVLGGALGTGQIQPPAENGLAYNLGNLIGPILREIQNRRGGGSGVRTEVDFGGI